MKIAILGSRGIPNNFGGFEQCAEKIGIFFLKQGHDVTVYNPLDHVYGDSEWNGIKIRHIYSDDNKLKFISPFIYDYLSLRDAIKEDFNIILELGAHPAALFYSLKRKTKAKIVTNMAGIEWKRSKWNALAKMVIKHAEKLAVINSDAIIADNQGIQDYIRAEYDKPSNFIAYGAELYTSPKVEHLQTYDLKMYQYYMLIARFQSDNNFEIILDGYLESKACENFIVIGHHTNSYGSYLKEKYKNKPSIRFVGGIYDYDILSSLRWYSKLYFHGHSCGGTNPSLLEAMASSAYIAAHDNPFNKYVLGENGLYFNNPHEVANLINGYSDKNRDKFVAHNRDIIAKEYQWEVIADQYLTVFNSVLKN